MDAAPIQVKQGLVIGQSVVEWVAAEIGITLHPAISQGIGYLRGGRIVMGAAFTDYNKANINIHVAMEKGESMSPTWFAAIIDYPFNQLGCRRLTGMIAEGNAPSRRFAEHIGGRVEGVLRDALPSDNLVIYGLLRSEAERWLTASYTQRLRKGGAQHG